MERYTITENEKFRRIVRAESIESVALEVGQVAHLGAFKSSTHKFENGSIVEKTAADIAADEAKIQQRNPVNRLQGRVTSNLKKAGYLTNLGLPASDTWTRDDAREAIDLAAGNARSRFVSFGNLTVEEYVRVLAQSREYLTDTAQTVPRMLTTVMFVYEETAIVAATRIVNTSDAWDDILFQTYDTRLRGKKAVTLASDSEYKQIAISYINLLNNI